MTDINVPESPRLYQKLFQWSPATTAEPSPCSSYIISYSTDDAYPGYFQFNQFYRPAFRLSERRDVLEVLAQHDASWIHALHALHSKAYSYVPKYRRLK